MLIKKKLINGLISGVGILFFTATSVFAQAGGAVSCQNCMNQKHDATKCVAECGAQNTQAQDIVGKIDAPTGVAAYNQQATSGIGVVLFVSNLIKIITIVAGVVVLFNFIAAGYTYITAQGDSGALNKVRDQILNSVVGLVIIVASYTIIAILSYLIFNDAGYILNPKLPTP